MATAVACDEPSNMECTVCHEHFTLPKLLPCGHLLCRHCLVLWLKSQLEANCPLCRCAIVDPKERKGRSLDDIADGFPTEMAMAALVEADHLLSKQHVCCVCVNVAMSMCLTCGDMLCQSCTEVHNKLSVSKHHNVENLASLTVEKLVANRPATCAVHDDEVSKLFCPTHGVSICLFCATADHRQCPEVTKLEKRMEEASANLAELVAMLSAGRDRAGASHQPTGPAAPVPRQTHAGCRGWDRGDGWSSGVSGQGVAPSPQGAGHSQSPLTPRPRCLTGRLCSCSDEEGWRHTSTWHTVSKGFLHTVLSATWPLWWWHEVTTLTAAPGCRLMPRSFPRWPWPSTRRQCPV